MTSTTERAEAFTRLHESGTFVMPNFWDPGSAKMLEALGAPALASTSGGFAQTLGKLDGQVTLEEKLLHLSQVVNATTVPVSADFEEGFATAPEACAANLLRAAETGIAGASIEDWSRSEIFDLSLAIERIQACAETMASLDRPFVLTARAENLIRGRQDLDDTIQRLQAYANAGADALYAPGLANTAQIETVLAAVDKPVNVLAAYLPQVEVSTFAQLGVRRLTVGGALANYVIAAQLKATRAMLDEGSFAWVQDMAPGKVVNTLLSS